MKRAKSFSSYGNYLEIKKSGPKNMQELKKMRERTEERPLVLTKLQPKFIEGFNRVTGRQSISGFQQFHTKDKNVETNYDIKDLLVKNKNAFYPLRKESQPRLNKLIVQKEKYEKNECPCHKAGNIEGRDEMIMTTRDLQKGRKKFHSFDFSKQMAKSHSYIRKPVSMEQENPEKHIMMDTKYSNQTKASMNKTQKVHSFASYTKRDFLSEQKINQKVAPSFSGAQAFKISQEKFKGSWKVVQNTKFENYTKKSLSRYDGQNPWHVKLEYNPKEEIVKSKPLVFKMQNHSPRKMNEVHSKYPFRIAV